MKDKLRQCMFSFLLLPFLVDGFTTGTKKAASSVIVNGLLDDWATAMPTTMPDPKQVRLPAIDLPVMDLKAIDVPVLDLKAIQLPVDLADLKAFDLPSVDLPSISSIPGLGDSTVLTPVVGLGFVAVAALVATQSSSSDDPTSFSGTGAKKRSSRRSSNQNLHIPYDAAALLAYDEWLVSHDDAKHNHDGYRTFKKIYEAKAVADATSKKLGRDLESFQNKAPPPLPKRNLKPRPPKPLNAPPPANKKNAEVAPFFFANEADR